MDAYEQANAATGTWMKISHCLDENGPMNLPEDDFVSIQHLKEYDYAKLCSRDMILSAVKKRECKIDDTRIEQERLETEEREAIAAETALMLPYQHKADELTA